MVGNEIITRIRKEKNYRKNSKKSFSLQEKPSFKERSFHIIDYLVPVLTGGRERNDIDIFLYPSNP